MLDTTNWVEIPFKIQGWNFVGKYDPKGDMYKRIKTLPAGVFEAMNVNVIKDVLGNLNNYSYHGLHSKLDQINTGATQALIELVD